MHLPRLEENLRGCAPDHYQPVAAISLLEVANVLADRLRRLHLRPRLLDIDPFQPLHVEVVKYRSHRLDRLEKVRNRLDVFVPVENSAIRRRLVGVICDGVPRAEHKLVQLSERHNLAHQRRPSFRPLPQPDRPHLRQRPNRAACPPASMLDARDERRRHSSQPDQQHPQLPTRGRDVMRIHCHKIPRFQGDSPLSG